MAKLTENRQTKQASLSPSTAPMSEQRPPHRPPHRYVSAKPLSGFIPKLTRKVFEKHGFSSTALISDWAAIAGPAIARFATPERIKWPRSVSFDDIDDAHRPARSGATLILSVDASRALEIEYARGQIIERVNAYFGYAAVTALKVIQRPEGASSPSRGPAAPEGGPANGHAGTSHTQNANASADFTGIENAGLRSALTRLASNIAAEARRRQT